jgi:hypothetical protein
MTKFRIIGAAALSLVLAGPAMAASSGGSGMHRMHHKHYGRVIHPMPAQRMSAQDFDHFDLGIARPTSHSGWGGPYHDGEYPGVADQNMGPTRR